MIRVPPTPDGIQEAVRELRAGNVIAYPTETVYGLGVDPFNSAALARLFDIKGRQERNPILLIVADMAQARELVSEWPPGAERCAAAFWPGPLSLVLPKSPRVPALLTGGLDTVCVRLPDCAVAVALCRQFGGPLTSTSANRSGDKPALSLDDALPPGIALGVDGGILPPSPLSTVLDVARGRILRQGAASEVRIREILSRP